MSVAGAAYALLDVSPHELKGAVVGLEDLWGRQERQLRERVAAATTWQERFTLVSECLTRRAAQGPSLAPEVAGVWDTIVATSLCRAPGTTARHGSCP